MLPDCYNQEHTGALNKIAARIPEAREFLFAYDCSKSGADNIRLARAYRWFGNINEDFVSLLASHLQVRFMTANPVFPLVQLHFRYAFVLEEFLWCNHLFMLLADPYYRWAASEYFPLRVQLGMLEVSRDAFYRALRDVMPSDMGISTVFQSGRNCLAALTENGLLKGKIKKLVAGPPLTARSLGLLLYIMGDLGVGGDAFDGSPLFHSLLKSRETLVPLFLEGERRQWWDFTGDRNRLACVFRHAGLSQWMERVGS